MSSRHKVIRAPLRRDRERIVASLELSRPLLIDAHARLRGPYAAGGSIVRALVPVAAPDLIERYDLELCTVAPELRATIPVGRETLFEQVAPEERTRIHSSARTTRIAHGLCDFLGHIEGPRTIVLENIDHADDTDRELIRVLLRRLDPAVIRLVVCTATREGESAADPVRADASRFVLTDGTCDDPEVLAAYAALESEERARLHDARADELDGGEWSLRLGAVPFHRERGTDPAAAVAALAFAQDHCFAMAFHHACVDLGRRGRALAEPGSEAWWRFTRQMGLSLTLLGRPSQSEALYAEARAVSEDPVVHRVTGYEIAMLYGRHHDGERRDLRRALAAINDAIAIASLLPDADDRAFYEVFYRNGKAFITMRLGDPEGALRMVDDGIARMNRDFPPDRHPLDRCTLLSNRARLLAMLGDLAGARAAYDDLIAVDPDYAEYRFDRAGLLHAIGDDAHALADYDTAVRLGPPFPEMHHNRAVLRQEIGDLAGALEDLGRVIELDPAYVDAYVNRAGLRVATGDEAGAEADVRDGLAADPGNPHLICVRGQLAADPERARADFDAALAQEPGLVAALAGRAALAVDAGAPDDAVADLTRALAAGEEAALLFNRAVAYRSAGRLDEARADLARALMLAPGDSEALSLRDELG